MKHFIDQNGTRYEYVQVDGYNVAPDLLDGALIDIRIDEAGCIQASFSEDSDVSTLLNPDRFLARASGLVGQAIEESDYSLLLAPKVTSQRPEIVDIA